MNSNRLDLFRGTSLTPAEILEHIEMKQYGKRINLWGYISTTTNSEFAMDAAYQGATTTIRTYKEE